MGNQEHCRLLREATNQEQEQQGAGRELWNNWRIAHPEVIPDLSGFHVTIYGEIGSSVLAIGGGDRFKGFNFSKANLTHGDFEEANFEEANLSGANLENAKFNRGSFRKTNLKGAIFKRSDFQETDLREADLSETDLRGISLDKAILIKANLSKSNLSNLYLSYINLAEASLEKANLEKAILVGADLRSAKLMGTSLIRANFSDAVLSSADLRKADLSKAVCTGCDFTKAKLQEAKLNQANLMDAKFYQAKLVSAELIGTRLLATNLIEADLTQANLTEANLRNALTTGANFERAELTGACLEDWHITAATNFNGVVCRYVYLKQNQQERCPNTGSFEPGEFTKLFEEIDNTINLIFRKGIKWKAFALTFNQVNARILDTNNEGEIFLREYKDLGDGLITLKVTTPPGIDKTKLKDELMTAYNKIASLEGELKVKNEILAPAYERLFLPSTQINQSTLNIQNIQNVEGNTNLVSEANKQYTFQAHVGSVENQGHIASSGNQNNIGNAAGEAKAEMKSIQHIHNYAPEQNQTLAEAAAEIQKLLKQLEQTNSSATEADKKAYVTASIPPTFRARIVSALKAGGKEALKELLDNPYINIGLAIVEDWQSPE
jgi:uncharacterized protein YjbI with pentapeptide repeats